MTRMLRQLLCGIVFVAGQFLSPVADAQCPIGLELSTESIVVNGDFSAGNTGFISDHNYCSTPGCLFTEGRYTVDTDPSVYQSAFTGADHTTGTGNFLIVNGATTAASSTWCQTIPVDPNSFYRISYWLTSLVAQSPASLQITLNGFPFFGPTSAPASINQWINFSQTWTSGLNTSVTMCLVNGNNNGTGNDFGIDDITVMKCECALSIDAGRGGAVCYGDSVLLTGTGATSYYWTPTNSLSCFTCDNPFAMPDATTTYTVTANGPGGCVATDTVTVIIHPPIDMMVPDDTTVCFGEPVQLYAEGAVSYQWSPASGLSDASIAAPVSTPDASITYQLSATDQFNCPQYDSIHITVWPFTGPVIASNDTTVCLGEAVLLVVNQLAGITWMPGDFLSCTACSQPLCFPDTSIVYIVTVTDNNDCLAGDDTVMITVDDSCNIFIPPAMELPTAFSPNGDGKNDVLRVLGSGVVSVEFTIYNRWGEQLFKSNNQQDGWDGTFNGKKQETGVYVWQLHGKLTDGTVVNKSGNVTLVR